MEQRTLYEIIGGGVGGLILIGLTYLTTNAIVKNNYVTKVNQMQVQLKDQDGTINVLTTKQAALRKEFDAEKKVWASKENEAKKRVAELEKQVRQGVSLEELRIACIEGEITKDVYKRLKRYTFK